MAPQDHSQGKDTERRVDTRMRVSMADTHKRIPGSVWLHTAGVASNGALSASYRIPPFRKIVRLADIMEVQRQAGIVHVHQHLAVSRDAAFALHSIELSIRHPKLLSSTDSREGIVQVQAAGVARAGGQVRSATQHFAIDAKSGLEAHGTSQATFIPKAVYARVRRNVLTRHSSEQAATPFEKFEHRELLINDLTDPILSDHAADHFSAMAMVCAIERSVTQFDERPTLASLSIDFHSYAELSPAPALVMNIREDGSFRGTVDQEAIARASFSGQAIRAPYGPGGN